MSRKVFFSFDYEADAARADQVRQSQKSFQCADHFTGYIDAANWTEIERGGDAAIRRWILSNLDGTSVTAVLYGSHASKHRWVRYEIAESVRRGNGLLAIDIHALKDPQRGAALAGDNPLSQVGFVISRTQGLVHIYENDGTKWVGARDSSQPIDLDDFRYSVSRDEAACTAIAINEDFWKPDAASNLHAWIEQAARRAGSQHGRPPADMDSMT